MVVDCDTPVMATTLLPGIRQPVVKKLKMYIFSFVYKDLGQKYCLHSQNSLCMDQSGHNVILKFHIHSIYFHGVQRSFE
jgi:hypothetical protein